MTSREPFRPESLRIWLKQFYKEEHRPSHLYDMVYQDKGTPIIPLEQKKLHSGR